MFNEMKGEMKKWDTVIIGGGQAGLATGFFLKKMNKQFIILDENSRVGDSWRKRWDSLKLFTPAQHDELPGLHFPGSKDSFPDKNEMADYLEQYSKEFSLPVQSGTKVNRIYLNNSHFEIDTSENRIAAENVVVATGTNPYPYVPVISAELSKDIFQIHSSDYVNPGQLPPGNVLVVGAATSGIEIALEISKTHKTFISGNPPFHIPDKAFEVGGELYWWFINHVVTIRTPIGKRLKKKITGGGSPLIRVSAEDLKLAGIEHLPRVAGSKDGFPRMEDDRVVKVKTVIWATGYKPDYSWIDMDITDGTGWPKNERGVSSVKKGLYFVGMPFQFGLTSGLVGGVSRDASFISKHISKN